MYKFDVNSFRSVNSNVADPGYFSRIRFFHPGFRVDKIPDPDLHQKTDSKFSKIRSGMSIPYPGSGFFPSRIRIEGTKKHRIPDPDPQYWFILNLAFPFPFQQESVTRKLHLIAHFVAYWENLRNCFTSLVAELFFVLSSCVTVANHCGFGFHPPWSFLQTR
jgi:hypothetical protein